MLRLKRITILLASLTLAGCNTLNVGNEPSTIKPKIDSGTPIITSELHPETAPVTPRYTPPAVTSTPMTPEPPTVAPEEKADTITPPSDLIQRIRAGFQLTHHDNPRIESQVKWYASHQAYLDRVQERAAPYLHFIVEEVEKRGIPLEIALLPVVESGFQPFAYSPGRAAGLWQFIPSTGKHYGLKQNWWYDGRRDVVAATRAALDYLQNLATRFDGDWELALAAYNSGAGNVLRAIKKNQKKGKPTDYWSLKLPRETMGYVPRLLAVAKVVADPQRYGVELAEMPNQPYLEQLDIGSQLDLALAAEMAGIDVEELYRLNPGFNRWATAPQGPHRLVLPIEAADKFRTALAKLQPEQRLRWKRYRIRHGDNLGSIARRHNTTVTLLQQINKLKGHQIRAGKHLLIPVASRSLNEYALSASARKARIQDRQRNGTKLTYEVRQGDSLWEISRRYNVSHKALARWNGISPRDTLRIGQKLVIWQSGGGEKQELSEFDLNTAPPINKRSKLRYRVRKGDSLSRIAQRFNVSVADLQRWNSLNGRYLQPGQRLKLFVDITEQTL